MGSILILGAKLVNEGTIEEKDVLVDASGRISRIDCDLSTVTADETIDATGHYLLPGLIDDQVHFREPGHTHKGTIASESRAAAAGGITTFMEMPNVVPPTTSMKRVRDKLAIAARDSVVNYSFYLGASNNNIEDVKTASPEEIAGVKIFMGSSTGDMLVDNETALEQIFIHAPTPIATHCEHTPTILENEKAFRGRFGDEVPFSAHPEIRSREACLRSSTFAVELARRNNARLHVLHITTAEELDLFDAGPVDRKRITAEACVHHLHFDNSAYATLGSLVKCNPAIKKPSDRQAIREAVNDGRIDVIATDHAPHTLEEKDSSYFQAPSGLPLAQHSLLILLELWRDGIFTIETIVERACHAPARLFEIQERGFLREGHWADLVLVDTNSETHVTQDTLQSKCGWSTFDGQCFRSRISATIVSGQVVYRDNQVHDQVRGHQVVFAKERR
jgi:dihydroorotase